MGPSGWQDRPGTGADTRTDDIPDHQPVYQYRTYSRKTHSCRSKVISASGRKTLSEFEATPGCCKVGRSLPPLLSPINVVGGGFLILLQP